MNVKGVLFVFIIGSACLSGLLLFDRYRLENQIGELQNLLVERESKESVLRDLISRMEEQMEELQSDVAFLTTLNSRLESQINELQIEVSILKNRELKPCSEPIILMYTMREDEGHKGGVISFMVESEPFKEDVIIYKVQTNFFFFPSEWIEMSCRLRTLRDVAYSESPEGLIHFHQLHFHHSRVCFGDEQSVSYPDMLVDEGEKLYLSMCANGHRVGDEPQHYAWICYVWVKESK